MDDRLLTTRQVAAKLGYQGRAGVHRVQRLIAAGRLRAENHGVGALRPRWMVRESELKRFRSDVQDGNQRL